MRLLILILTIAPRLLADGGAVLVREQSGSFIVTVFASPVPLRAGPVDVSVMIQDASTGQPVLDADVRLEFDHAAGRPVAAQATHDQAQNKLLYAARLNLPDSGKWAIAVTVSRSNTPATIRGTLDVAPAQSAAGAYWRYIAFPPVMIALFTLREWLIRRKQISVR